MSQTDGDPLPEFASVSASQNIELEYDGGIAPAKGLSHGGKITLMPDMPVGEHFAVLVHEAAHELMHRGDRRKNTTHSVRETEAEAVAFVVCSAIGLDTNSSSSDYIQLHKGNPETLGESLALVQQTASMILKAIELEDNNPELDMTLMASRMGV